MKNPYPYLILMFFVYLLYGCSAVPIDNRYKRTTEEKQTTKSDTVTIAKKDFDITKFRTKLNLNSHRVEVTAPEREDKFFLIPEDTWWGFESDRDYVKKDMVKAKGYRVLVLSTDKLDEAESIRAELYFRANLHKIYIDFESPFYKVKVGDYMNNTDAREMVFKLSQLGYSSLLIISDTINWYR